MTQTLRMIQTGPNMEKKADNSNLESALMKKINSANLKQKLARTIKTSMSNRNNANHLEVHVSGPFQNSKSGKSLAIMDRHG